MSYDAVIVGAGPAGSTLATLLARQGRQVALVDAARFPRQKVCGEYLSAAAWSILERLQLDVPRTLSAPLAEMIVRSPSGREASVRYSAEPALRPAALGRDVFDARLLASARREGVTVLEGFRARGVLRTSEIINGVEIVDVADSDGRRELHAPLVVAADGRRSTILLATGSVRRTGAATAGFKRHVPVADITRWAGRIAMHGAAGGYVGICPAGDGYLNLCGTIPRTYLQQAHGRMGDALRLFLGPDSPLLPPADSDDPREAWHAMPEVVQQRSRHREPGVLFVGDAMGTIEPLTGQGMTMALAGAEMVAELLRATGMRTADAALQRRYEAQWFHTFRRPIAAAAWFGRILRSPRLLDAVLLTTGVVPRLSQAVLLRAHDRTLTLPVAG
jgi:flavin-dependent dehydrogenase